jgi:hypothetical protein
MGNIHLHRRTLQTLYCCKFLFRQLLAVTFMMRVGLLVQAITDGGDLFRPSHFISLK